ncbi:hypothetical protein Ahy_A09g046164 [Arachis hypogaea]|uniref:Aminotransferase-like plant mobile domain-containing protein n=1 Tax=Arachis hypogaea TaxID=3818 RepID=A0A445BP08_ARAHY|nr:hypothetical protein Ahy_A09g046164 [Arachis hypogaea]
MVRQVGNDGDINRLNETTHYARAADFKMPRLLLPQRVNHTLPPSDVIVPCSAPGLSWQHIQQAVKRKESFTLKLVWLRDRVCQMPLTDDPETLRQYARCYIMLLIEGYLMTDKFNNLVHLRWLPLLRDFEECRAFPGVRLCWPGLISHFVRRHSGALRQQSRDQHEARVLHWRVLIDRLRFDETAAAVCRTQELPSSCSRASRRILYVECSHLAVLLCARLLAPPFASECSSCACWLLLVVRGCLCSILPPSLTRVSSQSLASHGLFVSSPAAEATHGGVSCFVAFRGVIADSPSTVGEIDVIFRLTIFTDKYLTTTGRDEDVWWLLKLKEWYDRWHQRFHPGRRISVYHTFDTRPTLEYYD